MCKQGVAARVLLDMSLNSNPQTEELILNLTGRRPVLFRPPYGAINNKVRHFLRERGYTIVVWSGGCIDW